MHANGFRGPQERAEVLRILQTVEDQDKERLVFSDGVVEDVGNVHVGIMPGFEDHALVLGRQVIQLLARNAFDRHLPFFGQFENRSHMAFFLDFLRHQQADWLAALGAQGFVNGIAGINDFFHGVILQQFHFSAALISPRSLHIQFTIDFYTSIISR